MAALSKEHTDKGQIIKILNSGANLKDPKTIDYLFEQYKLLVESSHKSEERRQNTNSFFIALNSIFVSGLGYLDKLGEVSLRNIPFMLLYALMGFILSFTWWQLIATYKKINFINLRLIEDFEQFLPSSLFTIRAAMLTPKSDYKKSNVISEKESILPLLFGSIYLLYSVLIFMMTSSGLV